MTSISKLVLALICAGSLAVGAVGTLVVRAASPSPQCAATDFDQQFQSGKVERAGSKSF